MRQMHQMQYSRSADIKWEVSKMPCELDVSSKGKHAAIICMLKHRPCSSYSGTQSFEHFNHSKLYYIQNNATVGMAPCC